MTLHGTTLAILAFCVVGVFTSAVDDASDTLEDVEDMPAADPLPLPLFGSYGDRCISNCHTRGEDYNWCDTDSTKWFQAWDYCSPDGGHTTSYGHVCKTTHPCGFHGSYKYTWCYTNYGEEHWDYCSLVDPKDKKTV